MRKLSEKTKERWIVIVGIIGVVAIWFGSGWYINNTIDSNYRGIVGDMFGAVNALFSGLAFAGLIYTITVQRKELSLQREAIKMQTEEAARSADQLTIQQKLMNYQLVLTTVHDLIKLKNDTIRNINTSNGTKNPINIFTNWNLNDQYEDEDVLYALEHYKETCFTILQFGISNNLGKIEFRNLREIIRVNFDKIERSTLTRLAKQDPESYRSKLLETYDMWQED